MPSCLSIFSGRFKARREHSIEYTRVHDEEKEPPRIPHRAPNDISTAVASEVHRALSLPSDFSSPPTTFDITRGSGNSNSPSSPPMFGASLFDALTKPLIMNGHPLEDSSSVWAALDALPLPRDTVFANVIPAAEGGDQDGADTYASIMVYVPLEPDEDSEIELARFYEPKAERVLGEIGRQIWIPSRVKVSVKIAWWGYRLYLPPDVMARLDALPWKDRAMLIAGTILWLISRIPMLPALGPQFYSAILVLKSLAGLASFLGTYIGYWWNWVKKYDEGQGVVLSATWLVPFALIPMAFTEDDED